jgi:hypothetical protein
LHCRRRATPLVALAIQALAGRTPSWWDQLRLVDSTPVPCAASRETVKRSALAGLPAMATAKPPPLVLGLRLYVLASPYGLPVAWCLAAWPPPSWVNARSWLPCSATSAR